MINFFILNGDHKRTCTATDINKATQILSLMFPTHKGYVVENNKVVFAHNMSLDEAEVAAGLKLQSMTVLPLAPKVAAVKPKAKIVAKPKKTKLKSKVVIKNKKPAVKKTVVKSKVKVKPKVKKAKVKAKKRK